MIPIWLRSHQGSFKISLISWSSMIKIINPQAFILFHYDLFSVKLEAYSLDKTSSHVLMDYLIN